MGKTPLNGLESVYHAERPKLMRLLCARTGNDAEAEDLLQELWIRVRQPSQGPIANGLPYLYRMAQNLVVDRQREVQRRAKRERQWLDQHSAGAAKGGEPADGSPNPEEAILDHEEGARLVAALETLPPGARQVLTLHKVDGLSHAQIADRLGISKSGVEKHMAVAMKYLRRSMLGGY